MVRHASVQAARSAKRPFPAIDEIIEGVQRIISPRHDEMALGSLDSGTLETISQTLHSLLNTLELEAQKLQSYSFDAAIRSVDATEILSIEKTVLGVRIRVDKIRTPEPTEEVERLKIEVTGRCTVLERRISELMLLSSAAPTSLTTSRLVLNCG